MSEDGYYYDDYEYLDWDDDPYSAVVSCMCPRQVAALGADQWQDDLAEHTMHSPVLISYDPGIEMVDYDSDWDLSVDEYFDVGSKGPGKKRKETASQGQTKRHTKRRKLDPTEQIPNLNLDETVSVQKPVVWRSLGQRLGSPELPTLKEGEAQKVALLKNWKAHIGVSPDDNAPPRPRGRPRKKTRKQSLPNRVPDYASNDITFEDKSTLPISELPPTSLVEQTSLQPEQQQAKAHVNGTSTMAKQAMRQASMLKENATPPGNQEQAIELAEQDDGVIAGHEMTEDDDGKPEPDWQDEEMSDEKPNGKAFQGGKRKAEDSVAERPAKRKRGRPKKIAGSSKAEAVPKAAGRKTRSKKF